MTRSAVHLFDLTPDALKAHVEAIGLPGFRARQILEWVYDKGVGDLGAMTNLSKADRALLASELIVERGWVLGSQAATDGVRKLLHGWRDLEAPSSATGSTESDDSLGDMSGDTLREADRRLAVLPTPQAATAPSTECVMIPVDSDPPRRTACISSQVGCPVGCRFCASGLGGLEANLTAGQIVEQVWQLGRLPGVGRITNVVFMGMGEPLANYQQAVRAIRTLTADWGLGISARRITLSTVGLPAQIRRLADEGLAITLAISLHAPNDALRRRLIPWAEQVSVDDLVSAGRHYFEKTGREVTLEYILLGGVNDQPDHARELASVARRLRSNVNLIRYNEVAGLPYDRPHTPDVLAFQTILREAGVNAHIRASRGRDIAAACGQLRHEMKKPA